MIDFITLIWYYISRLINQYIKNLEVVKMLKITETGLKTIVEYEVKVSDNLYHKNGFTIQNR